MPAATAEKLLSSASLACTINGVDYVTAKNIVSLEASFQNNLLLDQGFYPGSGTQDGAAIRGRLEVGNRTLGLKFTARFENGSTELTKVTNQTEGTAVLTLTYDANNSLALTFHRIVFGAAEFSDVDGLLTVNVDANCLYHSTNGLLEAVAKCNTDNIGTVEP